MIDNHDKFGIGNFKGFQEVQEIEIAPITLIFGQNSGGKTSLLQSILATSQSFSQIQNGKFILSGSKVDAGTFDTALNNKSDKKEIIIELSNSDKNLRNTRRGTFLIDSFLPIKNAKFRLFIRSIKGFSNLNIFKIEILFSDYLDGNKLTFEKEEEKDVDLEKNKNSTTYKLDIKSAANVAEITEKCFQNLSSKFKELFSKKEKGDWFDSKNKQFKIDFGKIFDGRRSRFVNPNFLSLVKHAALDANAILFSDDRYYDFFFTIKEISSFKQTSDSQKIFDLIKNASKEIFKLSLNVLHNEKTLSTNLNLRKEIERRNTFEMSFRRRRRSDLDSPREILSSNISFVTNYSTAKEIYNHENIFYKIQEVKNQYLREFAQFSKKESSTVDSLFAKFNELKNLFDQQNLKILELEDVHFSTLEKIKTDYKLTKNRQYLRDIILDFPFFQIKDLKEEDLNEIQKKTMTLIKKIFSTGSGFTTSYRRKFEQIELKITEIRNKYYEHLEKFGDQRKVLPQKKYKENEDPDINYFKEQIGLIISYGISFRTFSFEIERLLARRILTAINSANFDKTTIKRIVRENLFWLFSYEEDEFDSYIEEASEEAEREENIYRFVQKNYPDLNRISCNQFLGDFSFTGSTKHTLPSPFVNSKVIDKHLNEKIIHLGPSRPGAKRFYTISDIDSATPDDVAYFLKMQKYPDREKDLSINKLNVYLKSLDIIDEIQQNKSEDKRYDFESILVRTKNNFKSVNLADTGYGLSQLFPIIINAVSGNLDTILIQQPETHLHPRLQAEVGSILVDSIVGFKNKKFSVYKKHWIVETHSEIMLLRILKRIRKGEFSHDNLRVYYVDQRSDRGSLIKRMYVSEDGKLITQWPPGFFSNDIDEIFDM